MPSLIGDSGYNGLGGLAQNYRRAATGGSNYGTRRIQFYQVIVYGISNAEVAKLDNYRVVNNTEIDIDQEPEREFKQPTVAEAVIRAVQEMSEVYIVGAHDVDNDGPNYNNFYLTIGVSGDTVSSGNEMENRDPQGTYENYNPYFADLLYDTVDNYIFNIADSNYDGLDVYPVFIYGDHFAAPAGVGNYATPAPELKALRAATKAARQAAGLQAQRKGG